MSMSTTLRLLRRAKGKFQSLRLYEHEALGLIEAVDAGERVLKLRRFPRAMLSERLVYAAEVERGIDIENVNKRNRGKRNRVPKLGPLCKRRREPESAGDPSAMGPRRKAGGGV
jgi:hypothetical protein